MNSNSLLFVTGAITFLVTFSWFKYAAMEVFKKELAADERFKGYGQNYLKFSWWIGWYVLQEFSEREFYL
jgi:uncharacterized membrane protein (DUF106 family)